MNTTISFDIDANDAAVLEGICAEKGVTMQEAFSQFVHKTLRGVKRLPVRDWIADKVSEHRALRAIRRIQMAAVKNGTAGMSMEEIDAEIALCHAEAL